MADPRTEYDPASGTEWPAAPSAPAEPPDIELVTDDGAIIAAAAYTMAGVEALLDAQYGPAPSTPEPSVERLARLIARYRLCTPFGVYDPPLEEGAGGGQINVPVHNAIKVAERERFEATVALIARDYAAPCPDEPPKPETRHLYCPGCLSYFDGAAPSTPEPSGLTPLQREVEPPPTCSRCSQEISQLSGLYRCAQCHAAFDLSCIKKHFGWSINPNPHPAEPSGGHVVPRDLRETFGLNPLPEGLAEDEMARSLFKARIAADEAAEIGGDDD